MARWAEFVPLFETWWLKFASNITALSQTHHRKKPTTFPHFMADARAT
jgi:hypothetical protein